MKNQFFASALMALSFAVSAQAKTPVVVGLPVITPPPPVLGLPVPPRPRPIGLPVPQPRPVGLPVPQPRPVGLVAPHPVLGLPVPPTKPIAIGIIVPRPPIMGMPVIYSHYSLDCQDPSGYMSEIRSLNLNLTSYTAGRHHAEGTVNYADGGMDLISEQATGTVVRGGQIDLELATAGQIHLKAIPGLASYEGTVELFGRFSKYELNCNLNQF